jgi:hypothetical protein
MKRLYVAAVVSCLLAARDTAMTNLRAIRRPGRPPATASPSGEECGQGIRGLRRGLDGEPAIVATLDPDNHPLSSLKGGSGTR